MLSQVRTIGAGVGVGVGVGTRVGVGVGVGEGDGSGVCVTEGVAEGVGGLIATPLFQTSFLPDLIQVNFFPPAVDVAPTLEHLSPALTAAKEGVTMTVSANKNASNNRDRLITQRYQPAIPN